MHSVDDKYKRAFIAFKTAFICSESKFDRFFECSLVTC